MRLRSIFAGGVVRKDQKGFTLLEVLLSVVILATLTGLSMPVYASFAARNDLDITTQQVAGALRRAQTYAQGMDDDSAWSVEFQSTGVTLFRGTVFGSRNTGFDEVISLPGNVTYSGPAEIQFAKLTAIPSATGSMTFTGTANNVRTITLNAKGMVDY